MIEYMPEGEEVGAEERSNYERLVANRKAALERAKAVAKQGSEKVTVWEIEATKLLLADRVKERGYTGAIDFLNQLQDEKRGIRWSETTDHETTHPYTDRKVLVRDARNVIKDSSKTDAPEKYAMQILNHIRAAELVIDQIIEADTLENKNSSAVVQKANAAKQKANEAKKKLQFLAELAIENLDNLSFETAPKYNSLILEIAKEALPKEIDARKAIAFAKDMVNLDDDHRDIVTLTKLGGNTIVEADVMLSGLTPRQKREFDAIAALTKTSGDSDTTRWGAGALESKPRWFTEMEPYEQLIVKKYAGEIAKGNKVIGSQLMGRLPCLRNAYEKTTAIIEVGEPEIVSSNLHCGTVATNNKRITKEEQQDIANENVAQLQTFLPSGRDLNINVLNSETPGNVTGEGFIFKQTKAATEAVIVTEAAEDATKAAPKALTQGAAGSGRAKFSASPFNMFRKIGAGRDHKVFDQELGALADLLYANGTEFILSGPIKEFLRSDGKDPKLHEKALVAFNSDHETECGAKTIPKFIIYAIEAKALIHTHASSSPDNINAEITARMNLVQQELDQMHEAGRIKTNPISIRVDSCKSGKDRTGMMMFLHSLKSVCKKLVFANVAVTEKQVAEALLDSSHTQHMAGCQGGSIGCHSVKTLPGVQLTESLDDVCKGKLAQKSAKCNRFAIFGNGNNPLDKAEKKCLMEKFNLLYFQKAIPIVPGSQDDLPKKKKEFHDMIKNSSSLSSQVKRIGKAMKKPAKALIKRLKDPRSRSNAI